MVVDGNGKTMSKSTGNIVDPIEILEKYGADNIRWYMFYVSPVWTPLKFDIEGLKEVYSKFFNPLRNTYNFFSLYANTDNIDIKDCDVPVKDREEIDRWLLSRYNSLLKTVTDAYEAYDLNIVVKSITDFVSDDLSNWYIRRNRNRFWGNKLDNSKKSVYITTYEVLVGLSKMIAPVIPYLSEEIYQNLTGKESVHLDNFPKYDEKLIDTKLEKKMDLVRSIISTGRYVREENKVKVRQPLAKAYIDGRNEKVLGNLVNLIMEELNVKEVVFAKDLNEYMEVSVKPNFKEVGKVFGKNMGEYTQKLLKLNSDEMKALECGNSIKMEIAGEEYDITPEMVDIRYTAKEGYNVGMQDGNFIILDMHITDELKQEGNAREFVSKVQALRKDMDFDIADRIITTFNADDEFKESILANEEYVKNETLSVELIFDETLEKDSTLNDYNVGIKLQKKD
jgi:isoleucyl-tRNA synthetase